jgi:hypothetical protein
VPLALSLAAAPLPALAQVESPALVEGTINYLDRSTGDITVDDHGARMVGHTQVVRRGLILSQSQLRIGQKVEMELFVPYPEGRTPEVKAVTIQDDGS